MAEIEMSIDRLDAGRDYCEALEQVGLDIKFAAWGHDNVTEEYVLVIVSDFFELKGPLEISEKLFEAYNKSERFQKINPFYVRLHGFGQPFVDEMINQVSAEGLYTVDPITNKNTGDLHRIENLTVGDVLMSNKWIVKRFSNARRNTLELHRRWKRFSQNVDRIAA